MSSKWPSLTDEDEFSSSLSEMTKKTLQQIVPLSCFQFLRMLGAPWPADSAEQREAVCSAVKTAEADMTKDTLTELSKFVSNLSTDRPLGKVLAVGSLNLPGTNDELAMPIWTMSASCFSIASKTAAACPEGANDAEALHTSFADIVSEIENATSKIGNSSETLTGFLKLCRKKLTGSVMVTP